MIKFFPVPHPDECIQSLVLRYHIFSGNKSLEHSVWSLTGSNLNSIFGLFPRGIRQLAINIRHLLPGNAYDFIDNYTTFPFAKFFLDSNQAKNVISSLLGDDNRIYSKFTRSMKELICKKYDNLQYCESCCKEDYKFIGYPYLRRSHQLPFVTRCHIHDNSLKQANLIYNWLLTTNKITTVTYNEAEHENCTYNNTDFEIKYAKWCSELLINNTSMYGNNIIIKLINKALIDNG